jgi:predicted MPP superfamily phosphohydrolase
MQENVANGRTIAMGDIHGCSTALHALIAEIDPRPEDTIVTLGDYIDWGPDSRGVIDLLIGLSRRCRLVPLLGNHEEMLLAALESGSELHSWLRFGGDLTLASYNAAEPATIPKGHLKFVRDCRPYHETDSHIFVHANYWPNQPMASLSSTVLYWEPLQLERVARHYSGKIVVLGHTPQTNGQILDLGFLVCIDTDCSRGGWLTALEVHSGEVIKANQSGEVKRARPGRPGTDLDRLRK